jgi:hypothetical protein
MGDEFKINVEWSYICHYFMKYVKIDHFIMISKFVSKIYYFMSSQMYFYKFIELK